MNIKSIADNIKYYRKLSKLTQKELAEKTGLSIRTIQGYEHGKYIPKIENVEKIAKALNVYVRDIKNIMPIEEEKQTEEWQITEKYMNSWNSILTFLTDIYGNVEKIDVNKGYSCGFFYLVGEGNDKFILHAEDIDALCDSARAAIPPLVDRLKDRRSLEAVKDEYENMTITEEERQADEGVLD